MIIQDVSIDANSKKEVSVFWYESEYAIRNSKIRKKYSEMKKKKKKIYLIICLKKLFHFIFII